MSEDAHVRAVRQMSEGGQFEGRGDSLLDCVNAGYSRNGLERAVMAGESGGRLRVGSLPWGP